MPSIKVAAVWYSGILMSPSEYEITDNVITIHRAPDTAPDRTTDRTPSNASLPAISSINVPKYIGDAWRTKHPILWQPLHIQDDNGEWLDATHTYREDCLTNPFPFHATLHRRDNNAPPIPEIPPDYFIRQTPCPHKNWAPWDYRGGALYSNICTDCKLAIWVIKPIYIPPGAITHGSPSIDQYDCRCDACLNAPIPHPQRDIPDYPGL